MILEYLLIFFHTKNIVPQLQQDISNAHDKSFVYIYLAKKISCMKTSKQLTCLYINNL